VARLLSFEGACFIFFGKNKSSFGYGTEVRQNAVCFLTDKTSGNALNRELFSKMMDPETDSIKQCKL
jgi:hypothetical protein